MEASRVTGSMAGRRCYRAQDGTQSAVVARPFVRSIDALPGRDADVAATVICCSSSQYIHVFFMYIYIRHSILKNECNTLPEKTKAQHRRLFTFGPSPKGSNCGRF